MLNLNGWQRGPYDETAAARRRPTIARRASRAGAARGVKRPQQQDQAAALLIFAATQRSAAEPQLMASWVRCETEARPTSSADAATVEHTSCREHEAKTVKWAEYVEESDSASRSET